MRWWIAACALAGCGPSVGAPQRDSTTSGSSSSTSGPDVTVSASGSPTSADGDSTTKAPPGTTTTTDDDEGGLDSMLPDFLTCGAVSCGGAYWSCLDGEDNDGDGLVDLADPECTSICDDDENSFQTQLPASHLFDGCKMDCSFDGNSGQGDDGCINAIRCDPESPGEFQSCEYDPQSNNCQDRQPPPSDACVAFCEPFVLPGCDCFGCCTIDTADGPVTVFLESHHECSMGNLAACRSCTSYIEECGNTCDECEICIGNTQPDPACRVNVCDNGPPCSSDSDCACGELCHLACCWPEPPG